MAEITNVSKLIINYLTEEQYQTAKASDLINENELYIESAQALLGVAHPTGDGNLHVPATSTTNSGKVLTAGATAGSLSWVAPVSKLSGTATLATATWSGSSAPYSYALTVTGMLATDTPHIDRVTGTDAAAAALINTAWGLIAGYAVKPQTSANTITFYASAVPAVAIPIMYEVVRS